MIITLTDTVGGLPFSGTDYNNNLATLEGAFLSVSANNAANTFTAEPQLFSAAAAATTQRGVVNIGSGGFTGGVNHFAGHASGTLLALNAPIGFAGELVNVQLGGVSVFKVTAAGIEALGVDTGGNVRANGSFKGFGSTFGFGFLNQTPGADADVTISGADAENVLLRINTGAWTADHNVILPTETGAFFIVHNNSTFIATFKTAAGSGVAVGAGKHAIIYCGGASYFGGVFP